MLSAEEQPLGTVGGVVVYRSRVVASEDGAVRSFAKSGATPDAVATALRQLGAVPEERRTSRKLAKLVSLATWPAENAFFRSVCPHQFLETHYAVAFVPSAGRLYVSRHAVVLWLGTLWSSSQRVWQLHQVRGVRAEGRTLLIDDEPVATVLSDAAACARDVEAARQRCVSTRVTGVALAVLQARSNAAVPPVFDALARLLLPHAAEEGLFRVSGSARTVRRLALHVDEGELETLSRASAADLATLLKRLVADIPRFLSLEQQGEEEESVFARFLLSVLARVASLSSANRMTASNLAMVWTPVLFDVHDMSLFAAANSRLLRLIENAVAIL